MAKETRTVKPGVTIQKTGKQLTLIGRTGDKKKIRASMKVTTARSV